jgi:predicted enzyme related to lactoylglutathione lyase
MPSETGSGQFGGATPILYVRDLAASLRYYTEVLGFKNADWGSEFFTMVSRDKAGIYLCQGSQGQPGTWVWLGVEDAGLVYEEYQNKGAHIRMSPRNFLWAYEFHIEDVDGHVLRIGSESLDQPYEKGF